MHRSVDIERQGSGFHNNLQNLKNIQNEDRLLKVRFKNKYFGHKSCKNKPAKAAGQFFKVGSSKSL